MRSHQLSPSLSVLGLLSWERFHFHMQITVLWVDARMLWIPEECGMVLACEVHFLCHSACTAGIQVREDHAFCS